MESLRHQNNLNLCFHGDDAPCACACPFDFDLRSFMEKMQLGRFDAAFKLYRNAVVFPDIVWRICPAPCKEQCVRRGSDAPVSLDLLERACLEHARYTDPIAFNLPQKPQRIAVVGAGLSGLACAMKFIPKKYDVTIYESAGALGGGLYKYVPEEIYLAEFQKQFGTEKYNLLLHTPVDDLGALDYDAVYVSSGVDLAGEGEHIFRCPPDIGPLDMILDGIASLYDIEWYLKTGKRNDAEPKKPAASRAGALAQKALAPLPAVTPESGSAFSKEESMAEAKRCMRCDCSACLDNCELLRKYQMYPIRLMDEVDLTMNPVTLFTGRAALREISSCSQCGLCKQLCPVEVDIGDY
ncbi:MAG: 4Fe-4S dicluster domain-containing protein, partial [Peptococcaceae bacterium]|nr:4Fe-4S dicluster domain-containing protein [Peptococcaceae bacterium]